MLSRRRATGVSWYGNLRYGHDVDQDMDLYLDAYLPAGATAATPAVVLVHGGGHVGGDKCDGTSVSAKMAKAGIAVFTIEYPLATRDQGDVGRHRADARLAVTWVRANAGSFNVDPTRLGLWGTSAGVDIAYTAAYSAQRSDLGASVKAVAGWSGVYDFVDEYYRDPTNAQHVDAGTVVPRLRRPDRPPGASPRPSTPRRCPTSPTTARPRSWSPAATPRPGASRSSRRTRCRW